jgi:hypothetical protein
MFFQLSVYESVHNMNRNPTCKIYKRRISTFWLYEIKIGPTGPPQRSKYMQLSNPSLCGHCRTWRKYLRQFKTIVRPIRLEDTVRVPEARRSSLSARSAMRETLQYGERSHRRSTPLTAETRNVDSVVVHWVSQEPRIVSPFERKLDGINATSKFQCGR